MPQENRPRNNHQRRKVLILRAIAISNLVALLIIVIFFGATWQLSTQQAAFWDTILKGVAGCITISGAYIALAKYFDEKGQENRNSLLLAQAPFLSKRQEVYYLLVSTTAIIANSGLDDPTRHDATDDFWRLYWGALPMVADDQVSAAVDAFSNVLYLDEPISQEEHDILLRNSSMNLARACRQSLGFDGPPAI